MERYSKSYFITSESLLILRDRLKLNQQNSSISLYLFEISLDLLSINSGALVAFPYLEIVRLIIESCIARKLFVVKYLASKNFIQLRMRQVVSRRPKCIMA